MTNYQLFNRKISRKKIFKTLKLFETPPKSQHKKLTN